MIKNSEPLSIAEVADYLKESEESKSEIIGFIKKFSNLKVKEAKELKQELEGLNMIKIKSDYIIKMIDLLPETAEELNKIFVDVSLDEDEIKKILDTIKKYI
ncbi:hypothetical protein M0R19_07425 [Candidatus Pacearchaeota archaeon]|nr:hypothetical protein [Candidatus Pacearchaeota archaeon]